MSRQSLGVTFSSDNVSQDGHSSRTTDVADHVGQLDIHLRQRFLHVLDTHRRCRHQILSLPQITAQHTNLFGWPECLVQKPKGVQLLQPLAFLHIRFASRQSLGVLRMRHVHFQPVTFQHVIQCRPVHAGGLHDDRLDSAVLQPACHPMEVGGEAAETSYRFCVAVCGHGYVMFCTSHIDPRCIHIQCCLLYTSP